MTNTPKPQANTLEKILTIDEYANAINEKIKQLENKEFKNNLRKAAKERFK